MTAPLAFTHRKMTCVGVMPRRWAAFSTGTSTGPPGKVVIDLKMKLNLISLIKMGKTRTRGFHKPQWRYRVQHGSLKETHVWHNYRDVNLSVHKIDSSFNPYKFASSGEEGIPDWQLAWHERFWVSSEDLQHWNCWRRCSWNNSLVSGMKFDKITIKLTLSTPPVSPVQIPARSSQSRHSR